MEVRCGKIYNKLGVSEMATHHPAWESQLARTHLVEKNPPPQVVLWPDPRKHREHVHTCTSRKGSRWSTAQSMWDCVCSLSVVLGRPPWACLHPRKLSTTARQPQSPSFYDLTELQLGPNSLSRLFFLTFIPESVLKHWYVPNTLAIFEMVDFW